MKVKIQHGGLSLPRWFSSLTCRIPLSFIVLVFRRCGHSRAFRNLEWRADSLKASCFEVLTCVICIAQSVALRGVLDHIGRSVRCNGHRDCSRGCNDRHSQKLAAAVLLILVVHRTSPPVLRDQSDPGYWIAKASSSTVIKARPSEPTGA